MLSTGTTKPKPRSGPAPHAEPEDDVLDTFNFDDMSKNPIKTDRAKNPIVVSDEPAVLPEP